MGTARGAVRRVSDAGGDGDEVDGSDRTVDAHVSAADVMAACSTTVAWSTTAMRSKPGCALRGARGAAGIWAEPRARRRVCHRAARVWDLSARRLSGRWRLGIRVPRARVSRRFPGAHSAEPGGADVGPSS